MVGGSVCIHRQNAHFLDKFHKTLNKFHVARLCAFFQLESYSVAENLFHPLTTRHDIFHILRIRIARIERKRGCGIEWMDDVTISKSFYVQLWRTHLTTSQTSRNMQVTV